MGIAPFLGVHTCGRVPSLFSFFLSYQFGLDRIRAGSGESSSSGGLLRRTAAALLIQSRFPFKRITSQYLASLFRSRRARATLPVDPAMNTAINAYTSNYESCYSRDAAAPAGEAERDSRRAEKRRDARHPRGGRGLDTANKRRMRVNRVKQTRAALGNNEVTEK